jgi:hypothetical protein
MRKMENDFAACRVDTHHVRQSVRAWIGDAGYGDTFVLLGNLLSQFSFRRGVRSDACGVPEQEPR